MGILKKFNEYFYSDTEKEEEMGPESEVDPTESEMGFEGEEEEAGDYHGSVGMVKIAKALGEEMQGNEIMHDGHKINFFSETEMYHVDKKKFKTPEEVIEYMNNHVHGGKEEHTMESRKHRRK
jgi:hypothetical protein